MKKIIIKKLEVQNLKIQKEKKLRKKKKKPNLPSPQAQGLKEKARDPKTGRFSKSSKTISKPKVGQQQKPINFTIIMKVTVGL